MNDDLISREALQKRFEDAQKNMSKSVLEVVFFDAVLGMVDNAPAVDAVPVVHGRWYKPIGMMMPPEHHGRHRCSVCDEMAFFERPGREELSDYCPNCGAKMDG